MFTRRKSLLLLGLLVPVMYYIPEVGDVVWRQAKMTGMKMIDLSTANKDVSKAKSDTGKTRWSVEDTAMVRRNTEGELQMGLPSDNINLALLTYNVFWLFKLGLDQGPVVHICPHTRRTITIKSAYLTPRATRDADVVIFSAPIKDLDLWGEVKRGRTARQIWVYTTGESAYASPQVCDGGKPVGFGEFRFNMSFGYHPMFDVIAPFGKYVKSGEHKPQGNKAPLSAVLKRKTKVVAWVSSHCENQFWNRTAFVQQLSEFIHIDKYGTCGELSLGRGGAELDTMRSYKFVFALENACCGGYITEKFWQALGPYESVPIVIGASKSDYERVAPPNSFIHADDFASFSDLADYLRMVANDDTLYRRFHRWRSSGRVELYRSENVFPYSSKTSTCRFLKFLEEQAWQPSNPLVMKFDPFGREWLGSCKVCGDKTWLKALDLNSNAYNPTRRKETDRNDFKYKDRLAKHMRDLSRI